jgi:hypothetical protein
MAEMLDHFLDQGAKVGVVLSDQDSNWGPPPRWQVQRACHGSGAEAL